MGYYHVTVKINAINFHFTTSEEIEEIKLHQINWQMRIQQVRSVTNYNNNNKTDKKEKWTNVLQDKDFHFKRVREAALETAQSQILFCKKKKQKPSLW